MKLTKKAIAAFEGATRLKTRLAFEMGKSVYTVDRWVSENEDNGLLTTAKAVQIINEETGLGASEILEEETVPVK